jgi:hypothetical protein
LLNNPYCIWLRHIEAFVACRTLKSGLMRSHTYHY